MIPERQFGSESNKSASDTVLDKAAWHEEVERAVKEAQVNDSPLSVIFIDVNHFKEVNDNLGHTAGDEVIAEIRKLLTQQLRHSVSRPAGQRDIVSLSEADDSFQAGHIGGDEFAILCKTDDVGVKLIERRVRKSFDEYMTSQDVSLRDLDIDLAIGVSILQPGMTHEQLLSLADYEMYEDKLRQLPPLTDEQKDVIVRMQEEFDRLGLRLRDIGKYALVLSRQRADLAE